MTFYDQATGQIEKAIDVYEQWIRTYPRDTIPYDNVSLAYRSIGQHEKALNVASGAMRLDPRIPTPTRILPVLT